MIELDIQNKQNKQNNNFPYTINSRLQKKKLAEYNNKTISTTAREIMRGIFGNNNVKVTCSTDWDNTSSQWNGQCTINGTEYPFTIKEVQSHINYPSLQGETK